MTVPIIYDDVEQGRLTRRLLVSMKATMRILGDVPKSVAIDMAQWYDVQDPEDYSCVAIHDDLNLEVTEIQRPHPDMRRNRFCVMTGENGKVVVGSY